MSLDYSESGKLLILGVGNVLLQDDGFGIHVTRHLRDNYVFNENVEVRDGGTIGLSLLPDIEDADYLIVVDAGEIKDDPGEMLVCFNEEMDHHLSTCKGTVHEVSLSDILQAARLTGFEPKNRALVVVQPGSIDWGENPTPRVSLAINKACIAIDELVKEWQQ